MNNQWKVMPSMEFGFSSQQQQRAPGSITKNPNNPMFQSGFSMNGGNVSPSFGRPINNGISQQPLSPGFNNTSPRGVGSMHNGLGHFDTPNSSYGMGGSVARMDAANNGTRISPNGMGSGGGSGNNGFGANGSVFGNNSRTNDFSRNGFESSMSNGFHDGPNHHRRQSYDRSMSMMSSNGYDRPMSNNDRGMSSMMSGNGFSSGNDRGFDRDRGMSSMGGGNGFDRSMSTSNFDAGMRNGYDRQFSAPNLNAFGSNRSNNMASPVNDRGDFGGGSRNSGNMFGMNNRSQSPPSMYGGDNSSSGGFKDMKIGTWNEGATTTGNGSNGFSNISNFEIGTFNAASSSSNDRNDYNTGGNSNNSFNSQSGNNIQGGPGIRETGIIEKLLHSYGFIQCCDRQARLFFHFSQFDGNIEHLKIGDPVEFEMTYDRRTGKPIASLVSKIAPEVVMSEERVIGTVTTEIKLDPETGQETQGRISYENRGECFFLPFTLSDVEGNVTVSAGDKVSFQMATMARSGNLVARTIRLENPTAPVKYQGVINSLKDSFGFIERSDVVKEIFFHFTELKDSETGEEVTPNLGDDVEFLIQNRNSKEVAVNIIVLAPGTVIFEDVGTEFFKGQVLKPLDKANKYAAEGEVLNGRIKYRGSDRSEAEVPYGEKDQVGDFTLQHGDWVKFVIAVDRRDKLKRATKIELMDETFNVSDERREQGMLQALKEGFGFIKCAERDARMFFHFSEILDVKRTISVGDEVEFTVSNDPNQVQRRLAIRIRHLDPGTVQFNTVIHTQVKGTIETEPGVNSSWGNNLETSAIEQQQAKNMAGKILYNLNGLNLEIPVYASDCDLRNFPCRGDVVQFDINQCKATKETNGVNVVVIERKVKPPQVVALPVVQAPAVSSSNSSSSKKQQETFKELHDQLGYVAAMKDGFGFLETVNHDKEIFFHFSNYNGNPEKLEVGMEVTYSIYNRGEKGGKLSAENVTITDKGSMPVHDALDDVMHGKVVRSLRSVNPDQDDYCGLIKVRDEEGKIVGEFEFGIASLQNKKELLQVGDPIQFQISKRERNFAVNIKSKKEKQRSLVEAMKGQFGFLSYEAEEGKKLFFHMTEVENNDVLQTGDEVEFVLVTNKRSGKHSACCVRKISSSKRPERLISKLKAMNLEDAARGGKKVVVIRQPKGPEGGRGFKLKRFPETG